MNKNFQQAFNEVFSLKKAKKSGYNNGRRKG